MKKIVVAGGTGMIGKALVSLLADKGYQITVLSRSMHTSNNALVKYSQWSPSERKGDAEIFKDADCVINVSGENVAEKRWSEKRKNEIIQSRVQANEFLISMLKESNSKASTYISASAIGWYGPDTKETRRSGFKEEAPAYKDYLGSTCEAWEASSMEASKLGLRTVLLRTGIVLAKEGGAMKEFLKPIKSGFAAIIGSGDQIVSWIHIEDLCRMYLCAIENEKIEGVYNAVAPQPISNKNLTLTLAEQKRGRTFISMHVPAFIIKIMLGEMSVEVLKSTTVSADKIKNAGFQFLFPGIQSAISNLLKD